MRAQKFEGEVDRLKEDIASSFQQFSEGKLGAEVLLVSSMRASREQSLTHQAMSAIEHSWAVSLGFVY